MMELPLKHVCLILQLHLSAGGTSKRKLRMPAKRSCKPVKNSHDKVGKVKVVNRTRMSGESKTVRKRTRKIGNTTKSVKVKKIIKSVSNCSIEIQNSDDKSSSKFENETNVNSKFNSDDEDDDPFDDNTEQFNTTRKLMEGYLWKCTDCLIQLSSLSALKEHHQVNHNQPPNYQCVHCTKVYTRYRSFARHIKLHGDPKKFSCEICGKCFSQKTVLQSHSSVHSDERPHVCPQCGKSFKQLSSLYLHSKCHLPEDVKPKFSCTVCPKTFSSKHTLETHMKIHTGERNFICDICGKSFIAKGSLDYHILTHKDAKPHDCNVCGKGFKTVRLLMKHSTLHTGIKPHQCDVCGKQFRERSTLKEHYRIHTGAMPYRCEFCGKMFRFKGILTVHRRLHTGERPYNCTICKRNFTNWANYNKHMKRRHRTIDNSQQTSNAIDNSGTTQTNELPRLIVRQTQDINSVHTVPTVPIDPVDGSQNGLQELQPPQHILGVAHSELPQISVQQLPPANGMQLHMQSPAMYSDNSTNTSDNSGYKLMTNNDHSHVNSTNSDLYRVSHYVSSHTLTSMSYYMPPIHQSISHSRNQ